MANLMEYVGALHIFLGPYRGNPISLYLSRSANICRIGPKVYPWKEVVGEGDTPNRAAADFEEKWKARGLSPDMYTGPSWEGGIKPEKPAPPKPAAPPPKPAAAPPPEPPSPEAKPAVIPKPAAEPGPAPETPAAAAPAAESVPPSAEPA
ncbi:MAG: hypothetical protein ACREIK_04350 [Nitrospiraceae bacterium]